MSIPRACVVTKPQTPDHGDKPPAFTEYPDMKREIRSGRPTKTGMQFVRIFISSYVRHLENRSERSFCCKDCCCSRGASRCSAGLCTMVRRSV